MISYVKGILAEKAKDRIVVESGMMGIGIFVPMSVLEVLPPLGEEVKIYTHLFSRPVLTQSSEIPAPPLRHRADVPPASGGQRHRSEGGTWHLVGAASGGAASCGYDWGCEGDLPCTGRWGKDGTADHSRFEG